MMVSVYGYNKEKKTKDFFDVYMMAVLFAVFAAFVFIGGLKILVIVINFLIKNWVWVLVVVAMIVVLVRFVFTRRTKHEV